jgi:hypothetical protein
MKYITLRIVRESKELLIDKNISVLVYDKSSPLLIQKSFNTEKIGLFQNTASEQ